MQKVPARERAGEYLMMRLRTTVGISQVGISQEEHEKQHLIITDLFLAHDRTIAAKYRQ